MFVLNRKQIINPEMAKYIKEQNKKWIKSIEEKYSNNSAYVTTGSNLVKYEEPKIPNIFLLMPFVSLISFLAGYNFRKSIS